MKTKLDFLEAAQRGDANSPQRQGAVPRV
jgi:hypothetical protein